MSRKLLMGNEAVGLGAIMAGVNLVSGYPGTPSTEILETIAKHNTGDIYVEWSVNEKVAMEVGAGASYAGGRVLVTMKQVGLNVASDPLMSLSYVGVNGGMVIAVADDPGPISSQTEQDTRHYGKFANLPVFDPSTPEEGYLMIQEAFRLSEEINMPVILRLATRVCHACAVLDVPEDLPSAKAKHHPDGFVKGPEWVIFPPLAYRKHLYIEEVQIKLARDFAQSPFNSITGRGKTGIVTGGNSYNLVMEAIRDLDLEIKVLKIGTPYPFPEEIALEFMVGLDTVIAIEELDGVLEEAILKASVSLEKRPALLGKASGHLPVAGELSYELVKNALRNLTKASVQIDKAKKADIADISLPGRPPVLCAGCPHRASFYAVTKAVNRKDTVFTGDIGCYTLGNTKPLDAVDTCLCMGAGITIAQGLYHMQQDKKHVAFIGDSTFFHSGLTGVINAVYNQADITVIVLDNSTTAMTGHQPHPGMGTTMMKGMSPQVDIPALLQACGMKVVLIADPLDLPKATQAAKEAVEYDGPSAVIFRSPCIAMIKKKQVLEIDAEACTNCGKCLRETGCPALIADNDLIAIDQAICTSCELCSQICPFQAIKARAES